MRIRLVVALLLAACFAAHAQTTPVSCTAATLSGTYSLTLTGRDILPPATVAKILDGVGTITFDGVSAVTANLATTNGSGTVTPQTWTGTYSIPSNCQGAINFTTGDTAAFVLIPYNSGKDFTVTGQDGTFQFGGSGGPQPVACVNATLSGAYVFSGTGFAIGSGAPVGADSVSGLLQFDGAGNVAGNWTVGTNGSLTSDSGTGAYTMSSACTGTATVTDPNNVTYNFNYTAVAADGSSVAMVISTPANVFSVTAHTTFDNPGLAVANAAGVSGGTPPGSLFSIYGANLATTSTFAQETTSNWPTSLGGASVTVNGETVPLSYAAKGQINAQMPFDTPPGVATVVVKVGSNVSNAVAATVPATAVPGVFVYGTNIAIAQNFPSYTLNSSSSPAPAGSVVIVYFTGGGPVTGGTALVTGHPTPGNTTYPVTENASATIAGLPATVEYIGLTPGFVGLYQANILVPAVAKGGHNMILTVGGTASNTTTIYTN